MTRRHGWAGEWYRCPACGNTWRVTRAGGRRLALCASAEEAADGRPVYSRDEFVYRSRGRGRIEDDAELVAFAEKVTHGWFEAGWERSFATYHLSDYALSEPFNSLTRSEFDRLRELQQAAREERKAVEDAREWRTVDECHFADNSVEEVQEDKDGNRRSILKIHAHGDAC